MTGAPGGRRLLAELDLDASPLGSGARQTAGGRHGPATVADLTRLATSPTWGWVDIRPGTPTAAFSRRDALSPGYPEAREVARGRGFDPVVRPVGGRLAAFHHGALVVDVLGRHPEPSQGIGPRFEGFGQALVSALRTLGVDARPGAVPDEYCPGRHSVNARGRTKLAGTAQRINRGAFWLSALVLVSDAEPVRDVLAATYPRLGLPLDPATVGSVAEEVPGAVVADVLDALLVALRELLPLGEVGTPTPDGHLTIPLTTRWETLP